MRALATGTAGLRLETLCHLKQSELARRWAMSPRTLERWRQNGVGPRYLRLMGRVYYRIEDIEAFEAASLINPQPKS